MSLFFKLFNLKIKILPFQHSFSTSLLSSLEQYHCAKTTHQLKRDIEAHDWMTPTLIKESEICASREVRYFVFGGFGSLTVDCRSSFKKNH